MDFYDILQEAEDIYFESGLPDLYNYLNFCVEWGSITELEADEIWDFIINGNLYDWY